MTEQQPLHSIPELLAPAGEPDSFYGAINAGADAVYLAGEKFGARAYATNFDRETLIKCIQYAHLLGKKVYLTVNTLLKEEETEQLYEYIQPFYLSGLDAVIVQDLGVMYYLKSCFPGLEIHVSTQMTICNEYGARLLKEMGASRIVPARELSLREIQNIKHNADIEIETFVHGAMCYCYSGQCLFSSILGGRSGNRGRCAQPCRLPYRVQTKDFSTKELYPLSLKDMCTIDHLPEFIEAGIDSFKIEGRMKKPEYAAGVTDIYRRAIDSYLNLRESFGVQEAKARYGINALDQKKLSALYIRSEIHDGYYYKHNGKEMLTLSSPSYSGGDEVLYESIHQQFIQERKRLPIDIYASFQIGEKAKVSFQYQDKQVEVYGDIVIPAEKLPLTEDNIHKQLSKLGDTYFSANHIYVSMSENVFYSLRALNELRRDAAEQLLKELIGGEFDSRLSMSSMMMEEAENVPIQDRTYDVSDKYYSVLVSNLAQLQAISDYIKETGIKSIRCVYIELENLLDNQNEILEICNSLPRHIEYRIALPYIFRESAAKDLDKLIEMPEFASRFSGVLARSIDELGFLKERAVNHLKICADAGIYTWNHFATKQMKYLCSDFTLPYELNTKEQGKLLSKIRNTAFEKIVYGRIPMMITANCILKTTRGCDNQNKESLSLIDRYQMKFPVYRDCRHCYNIIYNSVPLILPKTAPMKEGISVHRLNFTIEDRDETFLVLKHYLSDWSDTTYFDNNIRHTTGHEKRGVE